MLTATARFTLRGEVKHYPDDTYQASIWLHEDGDPSEVFTGALTDSRDAACESAAETYRIRNHLSADTPVHAPMVDKMVGVLTPECAGVNCSCHQTTEG